VLAKRNGTITENAWRKFEFVGRNMRELEERVRSEVTVITTSMFLRAGSEGSLTPLYVNLPRSTEPLYIVALWGTSGSLSEVLDVNKSNYSILRTSL
jgi:hypothetical protein